MREVSNNGLHGIWRIIPSMVLTEIIAQSEFDFQILDCEHGSYDFQTLEQDIRICKNQKCLVYVRVSGLNKVEVQRCLDLGADGIVFPQLKNFEDFELATKLIQYPPKGVRGFNPFVVAGEYGFGDVHKKKIDCIGIIETIEALDDLDKILDLAALDMVYIGVYDLSAQLNCIGALTTPKLVLVINEIIEKCNKSSKRVSLMVKNFEEYKLYKEKGVSNFVHTIDSYQLKTAFINILENIKHTI